MIHLLMLRYDYTLSAKVCQTFFCPKYNLFIKKCLTTYLISGIFTMLSLRVQNNTYAEVAHGDHRLAKAVIKRVKHKSIYAEVAQG